MHTSPTWVFGPFEFDAAAFRLRREGLVVPLEPKGIDVLRLLLERAPAVVEKSEIFDIVWRDVAVTDNALTRVIAQLRRALDDDAKSPRYIETVATRGYRFVAIVRPGLVSGDLAAVEAVCANPAIVTSAPAHTHTSTPLELKHKRTPWMLAAVTAAVLVIAGVVLLRPLMSRIMRSQVMQAARTSDGRSAMEHLATVHPAQLTTGDGLDGQAAFSRDGTTIAFSSDRTGSFELYVQSLTPGAAPTALTSNGRSNIQPAWSPDGRFIAYHEAAGGGIWVVPSHGGTARRLAATGSRPAWSPDGRLIAYQSLVSNLIPTSNPPSAASAIWVVEPETGRTRSVTDDGTLEHPRVAPQWSANGRLFFVETPAPTSAGDSTLWSMDVATGERRIEARHRMLLPDYALAPDGSGAWVLVRTGALWWLPLKGDVASREPHPTGLPSPGIQSELALSPDGRRLAWTLVQPRSELQSVREPDARGRSASSEVVSVGNGVRATGAVAAPDGRLAYSGILQGSSPQIWIREANGAVRQVTLDRGDHVNPQWLPGFNEVAYFGAHDGSTTFSAVNVTTGVERELFRVSALRLPNGSSLHPLAYLNMAIDHSASRVVFALSVNGVMNLWVSDVGADGALTVPRQLTFERQGGAFPRWSPDGQWISYQCDAGADTYVCVIAAGGSGRQQITHDSGLNFTGGWIDSSTVLVAARRDAIWNVISVNRLTRKTISYTGFTDARSYVRYPQWDAAQRRVTFERGMTTGNIWTARLP
ncbi:MAG: winged helix-turn-helix domain-containing protein [Vicinamibacterales bacterium]